MTIQQKWKYNFVQTRVHHAINPNPYRSIFGSNGAKYAEDGQDIIDFGTSGRVAGFITEPIQGVGGPVEMVPDYSKPVFESVGKVGGVCISDEVENSFGHLGSHYWGFETQGVIHDITTMAKEIGNGLPLGAVVTTPKISQVLTRRCHFNTFGGNPVCTAGGHAILKVLDREKRQEHCASVGPSLINCLRELQEKYEVIGDVRGRGLMIGIELVTDRAKKTPAQIEIAVVFEKLKDMGVLREVWKCLSNYASDVLHKGRFRFSCGCHGPCTVTTLESLVQIRVSL